MQDDGWHPRSIRLRGYDYRSRGAYFVTVCADRRQLLFSSETVKGIIESAWRRIPDHFPHVLTDEFVVMPNHVHGILWIARDPDVGAQHAAPLRSAAVRRPAVQPGSLGAIVRSFKSASTKRINDLRASPGAPVWQRNYYEHVIRGGDELTRVREYIHLNPAKWELDRENPGRRPDRAHDAEWAWLEGEAPGRVPAVTR